MQQYKVISGNMEATVEADSHEEAAAKLFTAFDDVDDDDDFVPSPGAMVSTIEVVGDELWHDAVEACKRAGRWGRPSTSPTTKAM